MIAQKRGPRLKVGFFFAMTTPSSLLCNVPWLPVAILSSRSESTMLILIALRPVKMMERFIGFNQLCVEMRELKFPHHSSVPGLFGLAIESSEKRVDRFLCRLQHRIYLLGL